MDLGFSQATGVVVGGGRGMGFATARCLAEDGARVALMGRSRDVLEESAAELGRLGSPDAVGVVVDTSDDEQVRQAFADVGERWPDGLNVLINTVGPDAVGGFEDLTDDQWLAAVDGGVMGMVRCVRAALPLLRRAEWARIVNFSAHSTQRQSEILPAYSAAKAMVTASRRTCRCRWPRTRSWSTSSRRVASRRRRWSAGPPASGWTAPIRIG